MTIFFKQKLKNLSIPVTKSIAICGFILFSSQAFSQKGFEFGLRYMMQKTVLLNNSDAEAGTELDFVYPTVFLAGGVSAAYTFSKHFGVEANILISRQGQLYSGSNMQAGGPMSYNNQITFQAQVNNIETNQAYMARAELNVLKIPVLLKISTNNEKTFYFSASAGPQFNIIRSAVFEINGREVGLPGVEFKPKDAYRKKTMDGVLSFGPGYNFLEHYTLSMQLRFDYGFGDVENKAITYNAGTQQKYYHSERAATHNATAAIMFGLNYRL